LWSKLESPIISICQEGIFAHMVNFRVIRAKVVVPEKLLDVNIFSKNTLIPIVLFTLSQNNVCLDMASCDIQKYFMLIYAIGQNQLNVDLDLKPMPLSLSLSPLTFSPSLPNPQYLVLSFCALCLIPRYVLPALIPHKKRMMF